MILCAIKDAAIYGAISPLIAEAIEWLEAFDPATFAPGEINLASGIRIMMQEPALTPVDKSRLEVHRRFIDIQAPVKGTETMGWAPLQGLKNVLQPYDGATDVAFFGDEAHNLLEVNRGQMVIFFPHDAHAPNIGSGKHRKLCIKIPVI